MGAPLPQKVRRQRFRLAATAIFFVALAVSFMLIAAGSFLWQVLVGR